MLSTTSTPTPSNTTTLLSTKPLSTASTPILQLKSTPKYSATTPVSTIQSITQALALKRKHRTCNQSTSVQNEALAVQLIRQHRVFKLREILPTLTNPSTSLFHAAFEEKDIVIMSYLLEHNYPVAKSKLNQYIYQSLQHADLPCIELFHKHSFISSSFPLVLAFPVNPLQLTCEHIDCILFLHARGCRLSTDLSFEELMTNQFLRVSYERCLSILDKNKHVDFSLIFNIE